MKSPITTLLTLSFLAITQTSCKPKDIEPEALSQLLEQNAQMREDLQTMKGRIEQGESMQIISILELRKLETALAQDIEKITELDKRAAEGEIRLMELQERHAGFLSKFRELQQEIIAAQQ